MLQKGLHLRHPAFRNEKPSKAGAQLVRLSGPVKIAAPGPQKAHLLRQTIGRLLPLGAVRRVPGLQAVKPRLGEDPPGDGPVSYTHLTLPTICRV